MEALFIFILTAICLLLGSSAADKNKRQREREEAFQSETNKHFAKRYHEPKGWRR